jgi:hypothetical protein
VRIEAAIVEYHRANAELQALRTSAVFVRDLVLGSAGGSTSLAASLVEEVENQINTVATNGV